jgi:hypothetical protein
MAMFYRKLLGTAAALFVVGYLHAPPACADGPAAGSAPPSLGSVTWAGQGTTFDSLKGKTVLVLTYVTWCPKCNSWSGEIVSGLNKAIADKPVVVLAISTDTPAAKAQAYMEERDFVGPQILHGYDPTIARRLDFSNEFFNYAIVGPDGKVAAAGNAGSYYNVEGGKIYSPAYDLGRQTDLGKFRFLTDDMSAALKQLIFPMELGTFPSAAEISRLKKGLPVDDRQAFDSMLSTFLDEQLADVTRLAEGEPAEKLSAFDAATFLAGAFKGTEQGKQAKKLLTGLNKDKDLKKELAAKKLYEECLKQAGDAARQSELLRNVSKKFPGTHYAKLAAGVADENAKSRTESPE